MNAAALEREVSGAKVKLFALLAEKLPNVTDREARLLMHLVREDAIKNAPRARKS